jgi:hypothetical protein
MATQPNTPTVEAEVHRGLLASGASGAFISFCFTITSLNFFFKKKSGEAKDSVMFPFFILLHKRAKPILSGTS